MMKKAFILAVIVSAIMATALFSSAAEDPHAAHSRPLLQTETGDTDDQTDTVTDGDTDDQLGKMRDKMKSMQANMEKIEKSSDPGEHRNLMQENMKNMHDCMTIIMEHMKKCMKMRCMMMGKKKMKMMKKGGKKRMMMRSDTDMMEKRMNMMEKLVEMTGKRMDMMQNMIEQMMKLQSQ